MYSQALAHIHGPAATRTMNTPAQHPGGTGGRLITDLDLVMAHRLLYYVRGASLIKDHEFDALDREARQYAPEDHPIHRAGSDRLEDYDDATRALALYLQLRFSRRAPKAKPVDEFYINEDGELEGPADAQKPAQQPVQPQNAPNTPPKAETGLLF